MSYKRKKDFVLFTVQGNQNIDGEFFYVPQRNRDRDRFLHLEWDCLHQLWQHRRVFFRRALVIRSAI